MPAIHTIDLHFEGQPRTIAAYLIETTHGPILVETGPYSTVGALEAGIKALGFSADDVQHVFLTHIHLDHAGAAWYLASKGARVHVHPAGYPHLAHPEKLMASAARIYKDDLDRQWGAMHPIAESQLVAAADGAAFAIGEAELIAHFTPGHAIHHIAWQLGSTLFTGDVGGIRINNGPVVPPCPPPDIHIGDWMASIGKLEKLEPAKLMLTHFGQVDNPQAHFEALKKILIEWALWMKPFAERGTPADELTRPFSNYVEEQLANEGMPDEVKVSYGFANPVWMSVQGLLRYWRKYGEETAGGVSE